MGSKVSKTEDGKLVYLSGLDPDDWLPSADCVKHHLPIGPDDLCEWSASEDELIQPLITTLYTLIISDKSRQYRTVTLDCKEKQLPLILFKTLLQHKTTIKSLIINNLPVGCRVCMYDLFRRLQPATFQKLQKLIIARTYMDECYIKLDDEIELPNTLNHLTLYGLGLVSVPQNIVKLKDLEHLCLANNIISHISSAFQECELKSLTILDLSKNCLGTVPLGLDNLSNLAVLDLSHNCIKKSLPTSLMLSTGLVELYLEWNRLEEISPEIILNLPNLVLLDLSHNKIKLFSSMIFFHTKLILLNLSGNESLTLVDDLRLPVPQPQLQELDLSYTGLTSLPDWMEWQSNIKVFKCAGNQLTNFRNILCLSKCQLINLSHNRFTELNGSTQEMTSLLKVPCTIDLSYNQIQAIPHDLVKFDHVTVMLEGNPAFPTENDEEAILNQKVRHNAGRARKGLWSKFSCSGDNSIS